MALWFFAHRRATAAADGLLAEHGLNRTQFRALFFTGRLPGLTVGQLIDILGLTQQAVSRALGQLIDQGLIEQQSGRADRRQRHLSLSAAGTALQAEVVDRQAAVIQEAMDKVGPAPAQGYIATLEAMLGIDERALVDRMYPDRAGDRSAAAE
ncbi:MAG: MarR family transcriptional regulator [Sneathiellaceae bacterium]